MTFASRIILHCPTGYRPELDALVEQFLQDRVAYVGVVGEDCEKVEDFIDELVVAEGSDPSRFILTSSHPGETLADVVAFAESLTLEEPGSVQVVEL